MSIAPAGMDPKLAALLARRKKQQDDDGDAGYYMQDETPKPEPLPERATRAKGLNIKTDPPPSCFAAHATLSHTHALMHAHGACPHALFADVAHVMASRLCHQHM